MRENDNLVYPRIRLGTRDPCPVLNERAEHFIINHQAASANRRRDSDDEIPMVIIDTRLPLRLSAVQNACDPGQKECRVSSRPISLVPDSISTLDQFAVEQFFQYVSAGSEGAP